MSLNNRQELGKWGEQIAKNFLSQNGLSIIDCNVHTPYGEIDIVSTSDTEIIFIEVKTRSSLTFGMPEESVDFRKREHLKNSIQAYLLEHPDYDGKNTRIDVISIIKLSADEKHELIWFKNAFS